MLVFTGTTHLLEVTFSCLMLDELRGSLFAVSSPTHITRAHLFQATIVLFRNTTIPRNSRLIPDFVRDVARYNFLSFATPIFRRLYFLWHSSHIKGHAVV
jgi:hypothetical protein